MESARAVKESPSSVYRLSFRLWKEQDRDWLYGAIEAFLRETSLQGGDVLPTPKNVEAYITLGTRSAMLGDPCFIGYVDSQPAAFVFWIGTRNPDIDERWKTVLALGSYTKPEFRSCGIANKLRRLAFEQAKAQGYERIQGPVFVANTRGIQEFRDTYKAKPVAIVFEKFLSEEV